MQWFGLDCAVLECDSKAEGFEPSGKVLDSAVAVSLFKVCRAEVLEGQLSREDPRGDDNEIVGEGDEGLAVIQATAAELIELGTEEGAFGPDGGPGESIPQDLIRHLSPLGWGHINLTGDCTWSLHRHVAKSNLRPYEILSVHTFPLGDAIPSHGTHPLTCLQ